MKGPNPFIAQTNTVGTVADDESGWYDCRGWVEIAFTFWWAAVAGVAGEIKIQGAANADGDGLITFDNADLVWWGAGPTLVAATAGTAFVAFERVMPFMQATFDGAGGAANQINVSALRTAP
jgi:hypothetical protein